MGMCSRLTRSKSTENTVPSLTNRTFSVIVIIMSEDQYYTGTATGRSGREGLSHNLVDGNLWGVYIYEVIGTGV